jgi:hypothetical protein
MAKELAKPLRNAVIIDLVSGPSEIGLRAELTAW